jgi:hypothetical protein
MAQVSSSASDKTAVIPGFGPGRGTWTCHVCGDVRPDEFISVAKHKHLYPNGFEIQNNVRYCNDRKTCRVAAVWRDHGALKSIQMERRLDALERKGWRLPIRWYAVGIITGSSLAAGLYESGVIPWS